MAYDMIIGEESSVYETMDGDELRDVLGELLRTRAESPIDASRILDDIETIRALLPNDEPRDSHHPLA